MKRFAEGEKGELSSQQMRKTHFTYPYGLGIKGKVVSV